MNWQPLKIVTRFGRGFFPGNTGPNNGLLFCSLRGPRAKLKKLDLICLIRPGVQFGAPGQMPGKLTFSPRSMFNKLNR